MEETCGKKGRRTSPIIGCPVCSEWTPWSGETKTKMERWRASYWTYTLTVRDDVGDDDAIDDDDADDDGNDSDFHLHMTCRSGASKGNMMSHSIKEHKIVILQDWILTAMFLEIQVFWVPTPCRLILNIYRRVTVPSSSWSK